MSLDAQSEGTGKIGLVLVRGSWGPLPHAPGSVIIVVTIVIDMAASSRS